MTDVNPALIEILQGSSSFVSTVIAQIWWRGLWGHGLATLFLLGVCLACVVYIRHLSRNTDVSDMTNVLSVCFGGVILSGVAALIFLVMFCKILFFPELYAMEVLIEKLHPPTYTFSK